MDREKKELDKSTNCTRGSSLSGPVSRSVKKKKKKNRTKDRYLSSRQMITASRKKRSNKLIELYEFD